MNIKDYTHILGQRVIGYKNSKVLGIGADGKIDFEFEIAPGVTKHETKDLAEINIATIADG